MIFRRFLFFFVKSYSVARSGRVLAADIKNETRFKVPIVAIYQRFFTLFELTVLAHASVKWSSKNYLKADKISEMVLKIAYTNFDNTIKKSYS